MIPDIFRQALRLQCAAALRCYRHKIDGKRKQFLDHLLIIFIRHHAHHKMKLLIRIKLS